jgi:hypothetical protein
MASDSRSKAWTRNENCHSQNAVAGNCTLASSSAKVCLGCRLNLKKQNRFRSAVHYGWRLNLMISSLRFAAVFTMFGENTRELGWFVQAGMTAEQALRTATTNAAELLGPTIDHNRYYAENAKLFGFTDKAVRNLNDYIERNLKTAQRAVQHPDHLLTDHLLEQFFIEVHAVLAESAPASTAAWAAAGP